MAGSEKGRRWPVVETSRTLFLPVGDRNWNQQIYMESICIDGKGHNDSSLIVLACYRFPTKNKPIDFLPSLYSAAEYLFNIRNELLIISDLNFNMLAAGASEPDPHLVEFWDHFCLSNTITEPTPETNCSISLTNLIFTGNPECFALSGKIKIRSQWPRPQLHYSATENFSTLTKVHWISKYEGFRKRLLSSWS